MEYRELQQECKKRGLSAFGKKDELEARLMLSATDTSRNVFVSGADADQEEVPAFIFRGDDGKREYFQRVRTGWDDELDRPIYGKELKTKSVDPNNPARIVMHTARDLPPEDRKSYTFVLNGDPVQVDDEGLAYKLRHNSHFEPA